MTERRVQIKDTYLERLSADSALFGQAARAADFTAPVPGCPEWTVRDLVTHLGHVHRWAAGMVEAAPSELSPFPADPACDDMTAAQLVDWFEQGARRLFAVLRSAPADLECATIYRAPSALGFWARRQSLETAIHRADAEAAAYGHVTPFDDDAALDGIDELVLTGFELRPRSVAPATLVLRPRGAPARRLTLAPGSVTGELATDTSAADATISGTPSDVFLWLWNRPAEVTVTGDPQAAAQWQRVRIRLRL